MHDFENTLYNNSPETREILLRSYELFSEVLRYGTYLYDLIHEANQDRSMQLDTVLGVLYRESLEITDGISVLIKEGCVPISWPLVRSHFELFAQISFMFKNASEVSAQAYIYCTLLDQKTAIHNQMKKNELDQADGEQIISSTAQLLNSPEYLTIHKRYENFKKENKKKIPEWYNLLDVPFRGGILALLRKIDTNNPILYHHMSVKAHGLDAFRNLISLPNDEYRMRPLREPFGIASLTNFCLTTQCNIYLFYIRRYLEEQDDKNLDIWFEQQAQKMDELITLEKQINWQYF
jgi:hypothetical protein